MADQRTDLEDYLDALRHNISAPVSVLPASITTADRLFLLLIDCLTNPQGLDPVKMLLFSHSAFRMGVATIKGGAVDHALPILRQSLEASLYAFLLGKDPEMLRNWRERESSKTARLAFRNGGPKRARELLGVADSGLLHSYVMLEKHLIDHGAHPNVTGVEASISFHIAAGANFGEMRRNYLGTDRDRLAGWMFASRTAEIALRVFCRLYPVRSDLALMPGRIAVLQRETLLLINQLEKELGHSLVEEGDGEDE